MNTSTPTALSVEIKGISASYKLFRFSLPYPWVYRVVSILLVLNAENTNENDHKKNPIYLKDPQTCSAVSTRFKTPSAIAMVTPRKASHFSYDLTFLRSSCRY
jgi:hypothetical protein